MPMVPTQNAIGENEFSRVQWLNALSVVVARSISRSIGVGYQFKLQTFLENVKRHRYIDDDTMMR